LNIVPKEDLPSALLAAVFGFAAFSLASSAVYILNDIKDREKDRLHSVKRLRPIASGAVNVRAALAIFAAVIAALILLLAFARAGSLRVFGVPAVLILVCYIASNAAYSFGLKNIPLVDVTLLASGYVLRVLFGAALIGIEISIWLYLVVSAGAFYLGLGKRRNEIAREGGGTRNVLRFYTHNFLDKNMYVCQTLCVVFYSLWSIDRGTIERVGTGAFVYTVPVIFMILLKYSLNIERDSDGDPTSVILRDKALLALCAGYAVCAFCILINRIKL
jgi:4-hydroxybenzoate polyprenyltransferase